MIIHQSQPNRAYPSILSFLKKDHEPLAYEFSTQFIFNNKEDQDYMRSNNLIQFNYNDPIIRNLEDPSINPTCLRVKNKSQLNSLKNNENIDYFFGLYDTSYFSKGSDDFSFTIIDHPINQLLNMFHYVKYQIISKEEIDSYKFLLELNKDELNQELKQYEIDLDNFKMQDLDPDAFDFSLTKDFFLNYFEKIKNTGRAEAIKRFKDFYSKYYVYMLICACSFENFSKQEEWVDYFLSNPNLQDFMTYQNIKFTYPKSFIHASELSENHDFYGIMDSRKSLSKSLHIISQKTNMLFCLNNNFNYYSPMDSFTYKRKEIESVLEKDIYFFNQKKEALKSL
jgi:hypothetical protein